MVVCSALTSFVLLLFSLSLLPLLHLIYHSAARMLQDKMSNPALRTATGAYFRVGEVVLDKTIQFAQNLNENKDRDDRRIDSSKKDDDRKN